MIGVFDSGVGGLGVLTEIHREIPRADLLYVADRARAPYGPRTLEQVQEFSMEIADWLIQRGASTLVVACNTASAAALDLLRTRHSHLPIVGMEPAVKPAAEITTSGVIAVFATSATFQGRLFESVVSRFGRGASVMRRACPDWVELVEKGIVEGPEAEAAVAKWVVPVIEAGADALVLGCTHFSFLRPLIERVAGEGVAVIDPGPAVALQTARVAVDADGTGTVRMAASGDRRRFAGLARGLAGLDADDILGYP